MLFDFFKRKSLQWYGLICKSNLTSLRGHIILLSVSKPWERLITFMILAVDKRTFTAHLTSMTLDIFVFDDKAE